MKHYTTGQIGKTGLREALRHLLQVAAGQLSGRCGRKNRSEFVGPEVRLTAARIIQGIR